jgi:hypothetical protein
MKDPQEGACVTSVTTSLAQSWRSKKTARYNRVPPVVVQECSIDTLLLVCDVSEAFEIE